MIKHSDKQLEKINDAISRVKAFSDKLGQIESPDKEIFWGALSKIIKQSKESHTKEILATLGANNVDHPGNILGIVKFHAGCIRAYDEVVKIVEKTSELTSEVSEEMKQLKDKVEEIKSNIELQQ